MCQSAMRSVWPHQWIEIVYRLVVVLHDCPIFNSQTHDKNWTDDGCAKSTMSEVGVRCSWIVPGLVNLDPQMSEITQCPIGGEWLLFTRENVSVEVPGRREYRNGIVTWKNRYKLLVTGISAAKWMLGRNTTRDKKRKTEHDNKS